MSSQMRNLPDGPRGRLFAVLLLFIVLVAVYLLCVHWTVTQPYLALREQLIDLRDQELRLRMVARQKPSIEARLKQVQDIEAQNPGFLAEVSSELAAAGIMQRIDNVVAELGAPPGRCQVLNKNQNQRRSGEAERFEQVTISVRMRCELEELARIFYSLEGGSPQLFVDNLTITGRRPTYTRPGQPAPAGYLDVNFDASGFLHKRLPSNDKKGGGNG